MISKPNVIPQYITAFFATLMVFGIGTVLGYSSPVGLILTGNATDSSLHLTDYQNNWFSSITNIGAIVGCPLAGFCLDFFGRRGTILISFIPFLVGWTLIVAAQNFSMLLLGRILTGVYSSLIGIAVPVYIGEFSSPHIRGRLGTLFHLMLSLGILMASLFGTVFDSFRLIGLACAIPSTVGWFFMIFAKESPYYLLSLKKEREAEASFSFFRGKNFSGIPQEIEDLKTSLQEKSELKTQCLDLFKKTYRKPLLICLGLMSFRQLMGINALIFNMAAIFKETGTSISSNLASVIVFSAQMLGTGIEIFTVDLKGRKILLQISASVMGTSCAGLGVFFYLKDFHPLIGNMAWWLPFVTVSFYLCAFNVGFGPVPYVMLGELFTPEAKRHSTSIATMSNWASSFLVTIAFHPLQEIVHYFGAFWIFAGICFASFIFSTFCIFETKGKSLLEINAHFEAKQNIVTVK